MTRSIVFVVDLMQDVNILRPLFGLAAGQPDAEVAVLVSDLFLKRDTTGLWQGELREACGQLGIKIASFASEFQAFGYLQGKHGILLASAESSVSGHAVVHGLYLAAPPGFLRATLQHGFECVGFLQNAAHDRAHGTDVVFNADVICGWFGGGVLYSVSPSERAKLLVTGPPLMVPRWDGAPVAEESAPAPELTACLICENLHSVRLGSTALKSDFIAQFTDFAGAAAARGLEVWLRPHPSGRFTDIKGAALPAHVKRSMLPIYKEELKRFRFAVSAPSSVLFDLMAAEVPVAVWQGRDGTVDCRNYAGLPAISTAEDWWNFAGLAEQDRDRLLTAQAEFIRRLNIPNGVGRRYAGLLELSG